MKKSYIVCFIFLYGVFALPAQTGKNIYHKLSYNLRCDISSGMESIYLSPIITYGFFSRSAEVKAGITGSAGNAGVYTTGAFFPLKKTAVSLGCQAGYNINFLINYCIENNLSFGAVLRIGKPDFIVTSLDCSYLLKLTDFHIKHVAVPLIVDHTAALSLSVQAAVSKRLSLGFKTASYDMFYYPLFFLPYYELYGDWAVNPHVRIKTFLGVRYSDMFTLSGYISTISTGVSVQYKIVPAGGKHD